MLKKISYLIITLFITIHVYAHDPFLASMEILLYTLPVCITINIILGIIISLLIIRILIKPYHKRIGKFKILFISSQITGFIALTINYAIFITNSEIINEPMFMVIWSLGILIGDFIGYYYIKE